MDDMLFQVALSPDLDITPQEFARAWNESDEARARGTASVSQEKGAQFFDPMLVAALLSIPASVASAALYDAIKGVIARARAAKGQQVPAPQHIHIEQTKKPDGTQIIVIDIDR